MADWIGFALGSAAFAGLTAILAKIGVGVIPSNLATLIRVAVVLAFTLLLVSLRHEWPQPGQLGPRSITFLVLSGLTTGLSWLCYHRALQSGPVSLVSPIDKLSLTIAVLLAVTLLGERLQMRQWLGVGLMTAGALLLVVR